MIRTGKTKTQIVTEACEEVGVTLAACRSPSEARELTRKRRRVMAILRTRYQWKLVQIGAALNRSYASVSVGLKKIEETAQKET